MPHARSEAQADVFMAATRAAHQLRAGRRRVDGIAADAVENRLPPLAFEPLVIAAIVVEPETQKNDRDKSGVEEDDGREARACATSYDRCRLPAKRRRCGTPTGTPAGPAAGTKKTRRPQSTRLGIGWIRRLSSSLRRRPSGPRPRERLPSSALRRLSCPRPCGSCRACGPWTSCSPGRRPSRTR